MQKFRGKGLDAGLVLPSGDWALVLPTPNLAATSLLSPENFVQITPSIQKLFVIFQNTDGQTHRQLDQCDQKKIAKCL